MATASSGDKHVSLNLSDAMPGDIRTKYPDWIDPYPQIAVALGGSLPNLPEQMSSIPAGLTSAPKRTLAPIYRS
jgi:hypothetical protein